MKDEIIRQLAAFDDEALALLASAGLVRRARRDLEKGIVPESVRDDARSLKVHVENATVTFDAGGLSQARCDCPSTETCRHIVLCALWLKTDTASMAEVPFEEPEPITWKDLVRAHGKRVARAGIDLLDDAHATESDGPWFVARFAEAGESVRLLAADPLGSALCTCKVKACRHAAATVILYVRAVGGVIEPDAESLAATAPATQPARTRAEVMESAVRLFEEMLAMGVSQLSEATRQRLATLAMSALGLDLPRLAHMLRATADHVGLMLARDARWDSSRLFSDVARASALCDALVHAVPSRPDLEGVHRSRYEDVRALDLHGLGGYPWQTASGYRGLTLLFWSPASQDWVTWSEARPASQPFDPRARFFVEPPWQGSGVPVELSRSHVRLAHARMNRQNRLSGSSKTLATRIGPASPRALDFGSRLFDEWRALRAYAATSRPLGLQAARSASVYVVIKPAQWGTPAFDPLRQQLRRSVGDSSGEEIVLCAQYREGDEDSVRRLETLRPDKQRIWGVVARVSIGSEVLLWPVSYLSDAQPAILFADLPDTPGETLTAPGQQAAEEIEGEEEDPISQAASVSYLDDLVGHLETMAEHGTGSLAPSLRAPLVRSSAHMASLGLATLASSVQALCTAMDARTRARHLLRLRYLVEVAREAAGRIP